MKTLYIVRHAEAAHSSASGDHGRPLTPRGELCARELGAMLARLAQQPDQVLCSDSVRARTTAEFAHAEGEWVAPVELDPLLYLAPAEILTAAVRRARPETARLVVVAHQPGLSDWVGRLTSGAQPAFAPASVARVDLEVSSWRDLGPGAGALRWLVGPGEAHAFVEPSEG
ncbi:MAG: histidine phosphatase family protein [Planctomycetes bacterium]|nr:histidine phosphatase family protein [Planctomycetota bacterium]